jgi:predicted MPP superfamily phosphohydrolase
MPALKILHLSDMHYPGKSPEDMKIVLDALLKRLHPQTFGKPDIVIFSGDLVYQGSNTGQFSDSHKEFLDKVLAECELTNDRLFICPGNHDIDKGIVDKYDYIESGLLQTLQDRSAINSFVDDHWTLPIKPAPPPFQRLQNFYSSTWDASSASCIFTNLFVRIYRVDVGNKNVGIACFNTAWRSTGKPGNFDRGNLILGERVIDHAAKLLESSEIRLAVFHHPLLWLNSADEAAVDARLQSEFDILFCGHIHRTLPSYRATTHGDAINSQAGCLYGSRDYFNGFNFLELDDGSPAVKIAIEEYSDDRRTFVPGSRIVDGGVITYQLMDLAARKAAILPSLIRRVKPGVRKLANDQISLDKSDPVSQDIETLFVCPPLKNNLRNSSFDLNGKTETNGFEDLQGLLESVTSFAVIGRAEFGKTTLAHYIALKVSEGVCDVPRLPLMARFSSIKNGDRKLWRIVREYAAEVAEGAVSRSIVEQQPLFVIVDDVDLFDADRIALLQSCISEHSNVRWCFLVRNPAGALTNESLAEATFNNFTIVTLGELDRGAIRTLSANFMKLDRDQEENDEVYRLVMAQIQRTGLPRSGYIVSLMMWAMKNKSQGEILNEAVLLENLIDYVLGRMDYTGALRREFDFQSKSTVLQGLAFHFKNANEDQDKNSVTTFVINFLAQRGLKYDASEIVNGFIKCGILYTIGNTVSFRYRRFQEFFVAGFLRDNPSALREMQDKGLWLEYSKELDLFTARFRHESSFLDYAKSILEEMKIPEPALSREALDEYLSQGNIQELTRKQLRQMRQEPMTGEKIDALLDKTERRMVQKREAEQQLSKSTGDPTKTNTRLRFSVALEMYSEFIRNLEFADKDVKRLHLEYCLSHWETTLRGWLSTLKEAIKYAQEDLIPSLDNSEPTETVKPNAKRVPVTTLDWKQLISFIESVVKYALPSALSQIAYQNLGSEKLIDFFDAIIGDERAEPLRKLFCTFILLELSPEKAIDRLSVMVEGDQFERWFLAIVTQRLTDFYTNRPLPMKLREKFEKLVVAIELELSGKKENKNAKGLFLNQLRKRAYPNKQGSSK